MQIIIRLDDISPDMDWASFNRVRELLDRHNIKPLIGLVPISKDDNLHREESRGDFWDIMRELKANSWDIAQHGTYHVYETNDSGLLGINPFSEFAGLSYDSQLDKLTAGREELIRHGINTDVFMAPGHTYDENTLKALKNLGFRAITDGLSAYPYIREGIICVPCRLSSISKLKGLDTICIHTNTITEDEYRELEAFITKNREAIFSFSQILDSSRIEEYSDRIKSEEERALRKRQNRGRVADSKRLAWYMTYTNHTNSKIKWLKRLVYLPLLLTNKYKKSSK